MLRRFHTNDVGLTLVELMLAMFLMTIIVSAAASSLITFSRASVDNEHRVQATALVTRVHEELQSRPWTDTVLYEDEIGPLAAIGVDTVAETFEGNDLVTIPGPGCDVTDPDCRIATVPLASETITVDGRDYEVLRVISWVEPTGADPEEIKLFTTVVRWESLGRTLEERLDSTRAPTPGEVPATVAPGVQFLVSPQEVPLLANGRNAVPISLSVDFTGLGTINTAKVYFRPATVPAGDPPVELELTREGTTQRFTGSIAAEGYEWLEGSRTFDVIGEAGVNDVNASAAVTFLPPGHIADPSIAPVITEASVSPTSVIVGRNQNVDNRLCAAFTVSARVDGLGPDSTVTATYKPGGTSSVTMTPMSTPISDTSAMFTVTFARHSQSFWTPTVGNPETEVFQIIARTVDGRTSTVYPTNQMSFTRSTKKNGGC